MRRFACLAAIAAAATTAAGHEFWIMPRTFTPDAGEVFRLQLMHGERFEGDPVIRDDRRIERFELVGSGDEPRPTRGVSGGTMNFARSATTDPAILVYESAWTQNNLDAASFEAYLREEGLGEIARYRAEHGLTEQPGRERYRRSAKALLHAVPSSAPSDDAPKTATRDPAHAALDRAIGLPCEIVLESATPSITARVLLDGEPLARARVVLVAEDDPAALHVLLTDHDGRVSLDDASPDTWMITTLHMQFASDGADTDWQSEWASLVFSSEPAEPGEAPGAAEDADAPGAPRVATP